MPGELSEEPFWSRAWPWPVRAFGWAILIGLVLLIHWHAFESEDVTWLLLAADRLIDGGRWGADILETNTPGAVLLYLPAALAARVLPIAPLQACVAWVTVMLIGCSLVAVQVFALVVKRPPTSPQAVIAGWVIFSVLVFGSGNFALPMFGIGNNFGQRDAVIAGLLLPLLWLMLWPGFQRESHRVLHRLAVAMAIVAFCIKPQFVLPLAIWVAVAVHRHGWREALRRTGLAGLAVAGIAYIAFVLLVFPEWLPTARLAAQTYGAYRTNWLTMGFVAIPALLLLLIAWRMAPRAGAARSLLQASTIASFGYLILSLIEQKPWFYHQLPAVLTLLAALGLAVVARLPEITTGRHSAIAALVLAAIIPGFLLLTDWRNQAALIDAYERHALIQELHRRLAPGDPWAVISVSPLPGFPATMVEGYRWVLRGPSLWPLPGAAALSHEGRAEEGGAIATAVAEDLAEDLDRGKPKLIVIDPHRNDMLLPQDDLIALLSQTPRFAEVWSGYRLAGQAAEFDLYVPRDGD